jgi:hypothetical protein
MASNSVIRSSVFGAQEIMSVENSALNGWSGVE